MSTFRTLFSFVWTLIRKEPLLIVPSIAFFFVLNIVQAQYLGNFTFEKIPTYYEVSILTGIALLNCLAIIITTVMTKEILTFNRISIKNMLIHTIQSSWRVLWGTLLIVIPPFLLLLGILWGFTETPIFNYIAGSSVLILMMTLVIILQFFPIAALDKRENKRLFPIETLKILWKNFRMVIFFVAWLYFIKLSGIFISSLLTLVPDIGESLLMALSRGFFQGITTVMVAAFWVLGITDSEKSTVSQIV